LSNLTGLQIDERIQSNLWHIKSTEPHNTTVYLQTHQQSLDIHLLIVWITNLFIRYTSPRLSCFISPVPHPNQHDLVHFIHPRYYFTSSHFSSSASPSSQLYLFTLWVPQIPSSTILGGPQFNISSLLEQLQIRWIRCADHTTAQ